MYNFVTFYCGLNSKSNKNEIIIILYCNKLEVLKKSIWLDVLCENCAPWQNFELIIDNRVYMNFVNLLMVTWNPLTLNMFRLALFVWVDNKIRACFNNMVICILSFHINIQWNNVLYRNKTPWFWFNLQFTSFSRHTNIPLYLK